MTQTEKDALTKQLTALLDSKASYEVPDYQEQRDDVVGYWVPEAGMPIHGKLLGAKLFDGTNDPPKPAGLLFFQLIDALPVQAPGKGPRKVKLANAGDIVGVWAKPGMRTLKRAQDQPVWMILNPESDWKDVGKQQDMKTFTMRFPKRAAELILFEDNRTATLDQDSWLVSTLPAGQTMRELPAARGTIDTDATEVDEAEAF
jgi:hypothetical protein